MNKPLHHVHSFVSSVACFSLSHSLSLLSQSSYIILTSEAVALHVPRERCSLEFAWLQIHRDFAAKTLWMIYNMGLAMREEFHLEDFKQPVFPPSFTCFILLRLHLQSVPPPALEISVSTCFTEISLINQLRTVKYTLNLRAHAEVEIEMIWLTVLIFRTVHRGGILVPGCRRSYEIWGGSISGNNL